MQGDTSPKEGDDHHLQSIPATSQERNTVMDIFAPPPRQKSPWSVPTRTKVSTIVNTNKRSSSSSSNYRISDQSSGKKDSEWLIGTKFVPGPFHFILGRSQKAARHEGNRLLRAMVASKQHPYSVGQRKQKSNIVRSIVHHFYNSGGGFVRCENDTGEWHDIGRSNAHQKVAAFFRGAIQKNSEQANNNNNSKQQPPPAMEPVSDQKHDRPRRHGNITRRRESTI